MKRTSSNKISLKHFFSWRRHVTIVNETGENLFILLTVDPDAVVLRGVGGNVGAGVGANPVTVVTGKVSGGTSVQMGASSQQPQLQGVAAGETTKLYMTSRKAYLSVLAVRDAGGAWGDLLLHNRLVRFGDVFHVLPKHVHQPVQRGVEYDLKHNVMRHAHVPYPYPYPGGQPDVSVAAAAATADAAPPPSGGLEFPFKPEPLPSTVPPALPPRSPAPDEGGGMSEWAAPTEAQQT